MSFNVKPTKEKVLSTYRTLYIKEDLDKELDLLAGEYNTSYNNLVISMIEDCLERIKKEKKEKEEKEEQR